MALAGAARRVIMTLARCGRTTAGRARRSAPITRPPGHRVVRDGCRPYPSVAARHLPALRLDCAARDLDGVQPIGGCPTRDRGPITAAGLAQSQRATNSCGSRARGCTSHCRAGRCRHHRAGPFRFTANGETVARLEERSGHVHKGVEGLMAGTEVGQAMRIVGRTGRQHRGVCLGLRPRCRGRPSLGATAARPLRRGTMAQLERLADHINHVGAICNDASVPIIDAAAACSARTCWRWPTPASAIA